MSFGNSKFIHRIFAAKYSINSTLFSHIVSVVNLQVLSQLDDFRECFGALFATINGVADVHLLQVLHEIAFRCISSVAVSAFVRFLKKEIFRLSKLNEIFQLTTPECVSEC